MLDEEDYLQYYLPLLAEQGFQTHVKRRTLATAFVEFCDLAEPSSNAESSVEYHSHFKPSNLCLPRIYQKKDTSMEITDTIPTPARSCPTLSLTKYKIPFTFTKGLSAFSTPKSPVFALHRTNIPAANLPRNIKVLPDKGNADFSFKRNPVCRPIEEPIRVPLPIKTLALQKKSVCLSKSSDGRSSSSPFLRFTPNVYRDQSPSKHKHLEFYERLSTPMSIVHKKPKPLTIMPQMVGMENTYKNTRTPNNIPQTNNNKHFRNIFSDKNTRKIQSQIDPSVLGVCGVSKTKLELPFSVLRDKTPAKTIKKRQHSQPSIEDKHNLSETVPFPEKKALRSLICIKMPPIPCSTPKCSVDTPSDLMHQEHGRLGSEQSVFGDANANKNNNNNQNSHTGLDDIQLCIESLSEPSDYIENGASPISESVECQPKCPEKSEEKIVKTDKNVILNVDTKNHSAMFKGNYNIPVVSDKESSCGALPAAELPNITIASQPSPADVEILVTTSLLREVTTQIYRTK